MRIFCLLLGMTFVLAPEMLSARGKNKVITADFDWKVYETDHFKIFYYTAEAHLLEDVADKVEASYVKVSDKLQHQLNFKVPFIFFKTHEEFEQTNVFPGFLPRAVGAFAEPFQSRILMPVDLPPKELFALMTHELTHIFQYDMLYNNRISTIVRASAPIWFTEGMASYVGDDENNLDRMVLRDSAVNGGFGSLGNFTSLSYVAYRVGHAAFDFMEDRYGIEGVREFLWQYRKNVAGSVGGAIQRAFDIEVEEFDRDFRKYLRKRYVSLLPIKEEPDDHAREIRTRKVITTLSPELSPSGDLFAAIVPIKNDTDLVLISTKDGRIFKNLTKGITNRYTEINVGAYNGVNDLGWNDEGNQIVFAARKGGTMVLHVISVLNGKILEAIEFDDIRDAQAPIFSKDSNKLYFAGNRNGYFDLFSYDRTTKEIRNLTEDEYHDRNPKLSPNGKEIVYSSRRDGFYKIFAHNIESGQSTQLTSGLGNDIQASYNSDMTGIYFSSDRYDDIYNIYELNLESGVKKQYTDIITGAFSPQERVVFDHKEGQEKRQLVFTAYYQGRYRVYRMDKPEEREEFYDVAQDNYANVKDFKMSTGLKLDPERFKDYGLKGNITISGADVTAGATDDGRFVSNSQISFSDTMNNHVFTFQSYTISSFDNYFLTYLNRKNRWQWGAAGSIQQQFFTEFVPTGGGGAIIDRRERRYKFNDVQGFLRYPLSLWSRFDFTLGLTDRDYFTYSETGRNIIPADYTEPLAAVGFSRDTVRYSYYGPQHGSTLDLSVQHILDASTSYNLDHRVYRGVTRRSLFAFRTVANYSDGDIPDLYSLGGNNNLRGDFNYQGLIGSRRFLFQTEYRFPFVDVLQFPGFGLGNIRGTFFVDVGGAWFDNQDLDLDGEDFNFGFQSEEEGYNPDIFNPDYLIGSYGFNISLQFFGLPLNWTWSKRTNFDDFPTGSRFTFWIGSNF